MSIAKTSYIFIWILLFNLFVSTSHASNYDPSVEVLQRNLSLLNYKPGPADGLWGRKTQQSYETFLEENNLLLPKNPKSFRLPQTINPLLRFTSCRESDLWQLTINL